MNDTENAAPVGETTDDRTVQQDNRPRSKPPAVMAGAMPRAIVPKDMDESWRIATLLVRSGLAPRDVQTPERAMVAIMTGLELGLPPMTAIQRIAVINGRPCIWGDAVPAIAQRTGMLEAWDEGVAGDGDDMVARCTVTRRVNSESTITKTATFSVADAKKAGLWTTEARVERKGRNGEKYVKDNDSPWYRFPKRMLAMRARVAFRDLFADAMCGLFVAEELVGRDSDAEMRDVTPQHETIHNPLQDDVDSAIDFSRGGAQPPQELTTLNDDDIQRAVDQAPKHSPRDSIKATADYDAETGEIFDAKVDSERRDADEMPTSTAGQHEAVDKGEGKGAASFPPPSAKRSRARPRPTPRQPHAEAAGEPKAEAAPKQPEPEKASPAPNPALAVTLEQPWAKLGPADYIAYLWKWTEAWVTWAQDPNGLRDRYMAERDIRNNLGTAMDQKQLAEAKAIAAGAFSRLGGVQR
jgi:hypothetical protein